MRQRHLVGLLVCICVAWAASARADTVTYWNDVTLQAVTAERPGGHGFLDVALIHAAVHDAVQAIQRRFEPYHAAIQGTGSPDAAAGAAAYGVLRGIYPKQQGFLDLKYKEFLASRKLDGNPGLAAGQQAAAALLKQHRPVVTLPDYRGGSAPGAWRPTPSTIGSPPVPAPFSSMANVYLGETRPFTLEKPTQFRPFRKVNGTATPGPSALPTGNRWSIRQIIRTTPRAPTASRRDDHNPGALLRFRHVHLLRDDQRAAGDPEDTHVHPFLRCRRRQ